MGNMSLSIYMKGYYEDFLGFWLRENKANSKPIKPNLPAFCRKSEARNPKRVEWVLFEKTKPICRRDISA